MNMTDLLDELEHEARERAVGLEALGKLPSGFAAKHYPLTVRELRELRRLKAAGNAATDVDTYVALCKGLPVPAERQNQRLLAVKRRIEDARG